MSGFIPLSVPNIKGNENKYVSEAIESEWVSTGGSFIAQFESNIAAYLGAEQAVACQSGTAGIHLALKALEVELGDEVIVPTLTFIAAVNPISYCNATPVFMDCDDTLNMDVIKLELFLKNESEKIDGVLVNKRTGGKLKAIIIVHVFGNIANMEKIMQLASEYDLKVIEDATEALGSYFTEGSFANKFAGTIGDFGVYSFNGNKIITTGGGGMLVSKHSNLLSYAKYLSTQAKNDEFQYIHDEVGYNYRMTNIQAAIGVGQLERLESFIQRKEDNYRHYYEGISPIEGLSLIEFNKNTRSNKWFYSLLINPDIYTLDKQELIEKFNQAKIQVRPIWGLIHEQKPYINAQAYQIEKAYFYSKHILNIPCSTNLTLKEIDRVIEVLKNK